MPQLASFLLLDPNYMMLPLMQIQILLGSQPKRFCIWNKKNFLIPNTIFSQCSNKLANVHNMHNNINN